jgi:4-alpha-glucanotransferase
MRQDWIFHDSRSQVFRSPFGAVSCNQKIVLRLHVAAEVEPKQVILRLWLDEIGETKVVMSAVGDATPRVYQAQVAAPATPGILWYYFIVTSGDKSYYYGNNSASLGGIGQLSGEIPPAYQVTVYREGTVTPEWFKEAVMYQIFVDRFYNGEERQQVLNPKKGSLLHSHWDNVPYYIRDVDTKKIVAFDFFGGNLRGVMAKLPYLKELGITVIYFNPIFEAASNHRYDIADYKKIDPMLGDNELFAALCAQAGEMGISIILDGVFSHTGSDSIYFNREGNYPSCGAYQSKDSPYYKWYRFAEHPAVYESWWGIDTLPNVEELEPSYLEYMIEGQDSVVNYWLNQGAKGWRLDVVDELPDVFVKKLYHTVKASDSENIVIGEVWEDASHKSSYGKLREYLNGDELDSVMNYPFRKILLDFFLGCTDAEYTQQALLSLYENYPREHFYAMMNLIGTHDVPRVLTLLGEAPAETTLAIAEQAKYRLTAPQKALANARLKMLSLWQMTFPGVPCIYYGDEAGNQGYKDPFNRGTYPWGREDRELLEWYKQVIAIRNQFAALRTGEWISLVANGDVYGYIRRIVNRQDVFNCSKQDNTFIVLFNRNKESVAELSLDVRPWCRGALLDVLNGNQEIALQHGKLAVTLQPLEGKLLLQLERPAFGRECGVLLHPTALPSKYGIGDLGKEAYAFINFLHDSKQKIWQILPLNPPGYGESPYQCLSAFAGNHLLIALGKLVQSKLLTVDEVRGCPRFNPDKVEFDQVRVYKEERLRLAFHKFRQQEPSSAYQAFLLENAVWLEDYVLFMALKQHFAEKAWNEWPQDIAFRQPAALEYYRQMLAEEQEYHRFLQFIFFSQWLELKRYACQRKVKIIGDLPIFVAYDSSDVWANPHLFALNEAGYPTKVAGVPPDYFSATGQLWGNPHYRWDVMAKDDYSWWRERFQFLMKVVDIIRVDHFRGFEAYWEIPAEQETAIHGQWMIGPGAQFFTIMQKYLGRLPIIAEDLGVITPEVDDLKNEFYFPGMKVLQFSFERDCSGECRPFICDKNTAVYTGTHDNNTTLGWYKHVQAVEPEIAACVRQQLGLEDGLPDAAVCWRFIEMAYGSNANTVIIPLQDILCLDSEARMNVPGTVGKNWNWRYHKDGLNSEITSKLAALAAKYQR